MKRVLVPFALSALTVCAASAQNKPAVTTPQPTHSALASGKKTYIWYCASCHGPAAQGDGPAASMLKTPPPDLTTLARRHGGKFPYDYVSDVIRFGTRFASHGSSDMPVWGPVFGYMDNYDEATIRRRIKNLCDYLASLQRTES